MKFIKFTYVDAVTGVSIIDAPAINGPAFPTIAGLQFVWARESKYPTETPEFFGTVADDADLNVAGFIATYAQEDWEALRVAELAARDPVPFSVSSRQGQLALLDAGHLAQAEAMIEAIPDPVARRRAQIEWGATDWERNNPFLQQMWAGLGGTPAELDDLFRAAILL
jgi:hypothetical protein